MATFRTPQCQDGDEVLKYRERRCQGTKRRLRKPEHTKEHQEAFQQVHVLQAQGLVVHRGGGELLPIYSLK